MADSGPERLLVVYNADAGLRAAAADWLHKLLSPATYPCDLCALTHGHFGMRRQWAALVARLPLPVETLHRDEWRDRFPGLPQPLPAILLARDGGVEVLLGPDALAKAADVAALETLLLSRLAQPDRRETAARR